jgi:ATP-binding cassette, subfamily B, bacterial
MPGNARFLINKLSTVLAQLPYFPRALGLVWAAARGWVIAWAALLVIQGVLPVVTVYLTRALVNSLVAILSAPKSWENISPTIVLVALYAGVILLSQVLRSATSWIRTAQSELVRDHISSLIHDQSIAVDLAFYELPEYYDHLHRAREDAAYRAVALVESVGGLVQNGITLIAMAAVLVQYGPWIPVALLISTLPAFYIVLRFALRQRAWQLRTTADQRRTGYYDWILTSRGTAAELRLLGLGEHFRSAYQALRRRLRGESLQMARDQTLAQLGAGLTALSITGIAMGLMVWQALLGQLTLGDLALFYQAFNQGQGLMRTLVENVGELYSNVLFLGNLFEFLALGPKVTSPPDPVPAPAVLKEGIRFRDVRFRYPGTERVALQGLNLSVSEGQIAAIVGPNGAGKSTLIKLLCRLYDPDAGQILVGGIDLRTLRIEELRRMMAVLPQEYVHFESTVAENIRLGDLSANPDLNRIRAAARGAGADEFVNRLPQGYDSPLGKWFGGGTELSVGEWQRIATARALVRQAQILILDEPTSAMDPWAEAEWLARIRELIAGRIALVITHRLTTAMHADIIHVMQNGRIVESGSHAELLAGQGLYAGLWTTRETGALELPGHLLPSPMTVSPGIWATNVTLNRNDGGDSQ